MCLSSGEDGEAFSSGRYSNAIFAIVCSYGARSNVQWAGKCKQAAWGYQLWLWKVDGRIETDSISNIAEQGEKYLVKYERAEAAGRRRFETTCGERGICRPEREYKGDDGEASRHWRKGIANPWSACNGATGIEHGLVDHV